MTVISAKGMRPPESVRSLRGSNAPRAVLSVRGTSAPEPTPWIGKEGASSPPVRVDTTISNGVEACQPHGIEVCQATLGVLRSRLWQAGQTIANADGAAFAVFECAIERCDELKLPLDSCIEGPYFVNALLVPYCRRICGTSFPTVPSEALSSPNNAAGPFKAKEVHCLSESSVARLMYATFKVNETSSSVTVPPQNRGRALTAQG